MKYIMILSLLAFIAGCSSQQIVEKPHPQSEPTFLSAHYYALAETAFENNDLATAVNLFQRAVQEDPNSIHIKQRLLETLAIMSYTQNEYIVELSELGEEFFKSGIYSAEILKITADAYRARKNYERADFFYREALKIEKDMSSLAMYYIFRKEYYPPADKQILLEAIELPWKNREEIIFIARHISDIDPEKGLEILTEAYQKWDDEQTLKQLLSAFDKTGDDEKVMILIQRRLDEEKPVSEPIISFLIARYFANKNWDSVLENKDIIFQSGSEDLLKYLFFSAINLKNYEVGIKAGRSLEELGNIPQEMQASFYSYLAKLYFDSRQKTEAARTLAKSDDLDTLRDFVFQFPFEQDEQIFEELLEILQQYNNLSEDKNQIHYMLSIMYTAANRKDEATREILSIDPQSLITKNMNFTAASLLLQNSDNYQKAIKLIELAPDSVYTSNDIVSSILYGIGKDSLSYRVLMKEISENPKPHVASYLRYSILADKLDSRRNMLEILKKGLADYPQNVDLMNVLGYMIAKHEIKEEYKLAYDLLTEAVELRPESEMIWDSLAWLHFVDGKAEKALQAMKIPLSKPIENSEIAYHLGAIYLELGEQKLAKKYLELAVQINDDESAVKDAEQLLENNF